MDFLDLDIQKIFSESLDNIETTVDEWIETMKDKFLSEETLEVLDHCKVLLGRCDMCNACDLIAWLGVA